MVLLNNNPDITIITVTKREKIYSRLIKSIKHQDYRGKLIHKIIVDGNDLVYQKWKSIYQLKHSKVELIERNPDDYDGPKRLAFLRNIGVEMVNTEYMIFLDDDNAWCSNHISSLWNIMRSENDCIVHSHRLVFENNGQPYLKQEFPWKREKSEREYIYKLFVKLGIVTPGKNIIRDYIGMPHSCVDLGEWLFPCFFIKEHPFERTYSVDDWHNISVEDAKLSEAIKSSTIPVKCTNLPTLHYYLGGYSNNFSSNAEILWLSPDSKLSLD